MRQTVHFDWFTQRCAGVVKSAGWPKRVIKPQPNYK